MGICEGELWWVEARRGEVLRTEGLSFRLLCACCSAWPAPRVRLTLRTTVQACRNTNLTIRTTTCSAKASTTTTRTRLLRHRMLHLQWPRKRRLLLQHWITN